jgi:hypothetical protein
VSAGLAQLEGFVRAVYPHFGSHTLYSLHGTTVLARRMAHAQRMACMHRIGHCVVEL